MLINSIIYGISTALKEQFGDTYEIQIEENDQELNKPYFFIACASSGAELFPGKRYFRENRFRIQYVPVTQNQYSECNEVAERMIWCLEYITAAKDTIRGIKMKYEIIDKVLNFYVNYDGFVYKAEESTPMEVLESGTKKEGAVIGS